MIEFRNVTKTYGSGTKALSNVNISVNKGEFVFIVGPSGAGKSTLIKLLLKEVEPTEGRLFLKNENVTNVSNRKIPYIRRKVGIIFQDFRLLPNKTVFENIAFAMEIIGSSSKVIKKIVPVMLDIVGLAHKADNYPYQLSGGEQQRVSIARAIVNNPSVLIADEPTGNLDPDTAWEIMKLLNEINKRGTTVLMVTHARDIVDIMKRRVIQLKSGQVVRDEVKGVYGDEI